jgi:transposase
MKENLSGLWNYLSVGWAKRFMKRWLAWVKKSDLSPMRKVGKMLARHRDNILTFYRHRITNGAAEGLNSKIMDIKRRARGYRNRAHFKSAIYFFCGGLDLDSRQA